MIDQRKYRIIDRKDTFFWDASIDDGVRTVGFTFFLPSSQTLRLSRFLSESPNASVDNFEVSVDLCPGIPHRWDCVEVFDSEVYQAVGDPTDRAILATVTIAILWSSQRLQSG